MKLVRHEPYVGGYITSDKGEVFLIDNQDVNFIEKSGKYRIIRNKNNPPNCFSAPVRVQIQTTENCNLRCVTCAVANKRRFFGLETNKIKEVLDYLAEWGVLNIEWSGGEPLLRKDFCDLVWYANRLGFEQNLLTNGTLFNSENSKFLRKYFFNTQISLDGVCDVYNRIVGRDYWEKFKKSLRCFLDEKPKGLIAAVVLQKENVSNIDSVIEFCGDNGLKDVRVSMQVSLGRSECISWNEYNGVIDQFRCQLPKLEKLAKSKNVFLDTFLGKIDHDGDVDDVGRLISPGGYSFVYINARGDIFPFPFLFDDVFRVGSIDKDDLREKWFKSEVFKELRTCTYEATGCGKCRKECAFFERSLVYSFTGDIKGRALSHEECDISRERR
jgi:MoaA/NifB/PqqE/SkfB family radical SAM enzyme